MNYLEEGQEKTFTYLSDIFKKHPINWNKVIQQEVIKSLYFKAISALTDIRNDPSLLTTNLLFNMFLNENIPSAEDDTKFQKFINSKEYAELRDIDHINNVDLTDFICVLFLGLSNQLKSEIKSCNKGKICITLYGSQLVTHQYARSFNGRGRPTDDNIKLFIITIKEYIKKNTININTSLFYKLVSYIQDYSGSSSTEAARKQFQRLKTKKLPYSDALYNEFLGKYTNRKFNILRILEPSTYVEMVEYITNLWNLGNGRIPKIPMPIRFALANDLDDVNLKRSPFAS